MPGTLLTRSSSNLRKVEILLKECERAGKRVDYYALDLSLVELKRTFAEVSPDSFNYVGFHGLHGTYDDALVWLKNPENRTRPTVVLSMGSSIGNFTRSGAAGFLGGYSKLLGPSDFMLIGLDACKDPERVFKAYNDSEGVTRQFYENGLTHANRVLGYEAFKSDEWEVVTGFNSDHGCHQACYSPNVDVTINGITIPKGEKLLFEEAFKYGREERDELFRNASLISQKRFGNSTDDFRMSLPSLRLSGDVPLERDVSWQWKWCFGKLANRRITLDVYLLSPVNLEHPTKPSQYAPYPVPTLREFQNLWTAWDIVTKTMVPREELLTKPIKLRNVLIFYLGHIPTFLGSYMTNSIWIQL